MSLSNHWGLCLRLLKYDEEWLGDHIKHFLQDPVMHVIGPYRLVHFWPREMARFMGNSSVLHGP